MNEVEFLRDRSIFGTREFAFLCGSSASSASRKLARLEARGVLVRVSRGIWCQPAHRDFTPNQAAGLLLGNERGYVSFLSALHAHGVISQIPASVQIATTGHGRVVSSPVGRYEFFRIKPELMSSGFAMSETKPPYLLATGEKALLDTVYISTRRGKRFGRLPEIDVSVLDLKKLASLFAAQKYTHGIASAIRKRFDEIGIAKLNSYAIDFSSLYWSST